MKAEEMELKSYPMVIGPDRYGDGAFCYVATHPDLPGCVGYGSSLSEATHKLAQARQAYLLELEARGEEPPEPSNSPTVEWLFRSGDDEEEFRTSSILMVQGKGIDKVRAR